ncbi:THAP domain-containing protein 1 [Solenopsis invicta]|uniref:THAP domain-containing protein 1 n=1 Tax=Solenopsis invicta TaxID=13686 RepID=UPI000E3403E4|nr:THAP domain-containing protein 1 [Solenopsis invicta]
MVAYCFVEGCTSSNYKKITEKNKSTIPMYGFPSDKELKEKWINALLILNKQSNATKPSKYSKICIKHFTKDQIEQIGLQQSTRLKRNAVPSIFPNAEQNENISENGDNLDYKIKIEEAELNDPYYSVSIIQNLNKNSIECSKTTEINLNELQENIKKEPVDHQFNEENDASSSNMHVKECIVDQSTKIFTKKIRYPGDITDTLIENMSRNELIDIIKMLREVIKKKKMLIKSLQTQLFRKNKKK